MFIKTKITSEAMQHYIILGKFNIQSVEVKIMHKVNH